MLEVLENKWKCQVCGRRYSVEEAKKQNNYCCNKYMTKILVLTKKA